MYELREKTALVTGAAKRIGRGIALGLAGQGADIVIHYRKSSVEARELQEEIAELGVKSWLVGADLGGVRSCQQLIKQAYEAAGRIDILVNNASVFSIDEASKVGPESINKNMLTNAWAPFFLGEFFSKKTTEGRIINILDTRIVGYDFDHFAYYLSKRVLEILTKSMALKLAPKVTVNGVAPGLILPPEGKDTDYLKPKEEGVPMKKHGSVSNVVDAVLFLVRNDFITGQVIFVDGGKHLLQTVEGLET